MPEQALGSAFTFVVGGQEGALSAIRAAVRRAAVLLAERAPRPERPASTGLARRRRRRDPRLAADRSGRGPRPRAHDQPRPTTGRSSTCASAIVPALNVRGALVVAVLSLAILLPFAPQRRVRPELAYVLHGRRLHAAGNQGRRAPGSAVRLDVAGELDRLLRDPGDDPVQQSVRAGVQAVAALAVLCAARPCSLVVAIAGADEHVPQPARALRGSSSRARSCSCRSSSPA